MQFKFHVTIKSIDQLKALLNIDNKLIGRIYIESECANECVSLLDKLSIEEVFICAPYVFRKTCIATFLNCLNSYSFDGILIRNIEEYSYFNLNYTDYNDYSFAIDNGLYILNAEAYDFYVSNSKINITDLYYSYELNEKEILELRKEILSLNDSVINMSIVAYGKIPMMVSANCINKTTQNCKKKREFIYIYDRLNKKMPVYAVCDYCYNVIYNSVPLSLHRYCCNFLKQCNVRLDFTDECYEEAISIINNYIDSLNKDVSSRFMEYTTGHYKRGVE